MRIANHDGRLVLVSAAAESAGAGVDVETASGGKFSADPQAIYENWDQFRDWAADVSADASVVIDPALLGPPVPRPRQVFAIGLNYLEHAAESKMTGGAVAADVHEVPDLSHRALRHGRAAGRARGLGGRTRRGHRARRQSGG